MRELKIGFLQQHNTADTRNNILRLAEGISDLAKRGAQLIVLQELHNSLYFCQTENVDNFDLAEPIPGPKRRQFRSGRAYTRPFNETFRRIGQAVRCGHRRLAVRETCTWALS